MAAIKGQPGTKPSQVESPVPGASEAMSLDKFAGEAAKGAAEAAPSLDQFAAQSGQASSAPVGYQGPGSGTLQTIADAAPEVMGIAGGVAGRTAGLPGMTAMGMFTAAGGMGIRQVIEQDILGSKQKENTEQRLIGMRDAAGKIGAELLTGEAAIRGAVKGGALALETKAGQFIADKVATTVQPILEYAGSFVDNIKKTMIKPAADWLEANMAQGTAEESGDTVKQKLQQIIGDKYQQFKQRYADINTAAAATPMSDASRVKLTSALRADAVDSPQNIYGMVKNYAQRIDAGTSAQDAHQVIADVNNEITRLSKYQTSPAVRDKLAALQQFSDRATDYMENYTHGIAKRVASGAASPSEMQGFQQMMEQQANPTVPVGEQNLGAYAKSVAKDYIEQRNMVNADYAKFRSFLEDTGEQAGVKAQGRGPMQFMREVDRVPSEQLVKRMFLKDNAAALRDLSEVSPEVFNDVRGALIRDTYNKSMTADKLDVAKLADNFKALPESSRPLIIAPEDLAKLRAVANNNNLKLLDRLHDNMIANAIKSTLDITRASALAGAKLSKDAYGTSVGKVLSAQAVGGAGVMATGRNPIPGR